ncbi:ribonuclease III [Fodinibius sp. Rm-B-1B1-1]|uniref:ribonuclease III n=1 Tax=Fodinibius alkaliphilus TaxID=3140241 RepID=UPI00315AFD5E
MFERLRSYFQSDEELPPEQKERIQKLEGIIDTKVDNPFMYIRALRHRSMLADDNFSSVDSYERLEFLGDAVLDLIVTEIIFDLFPQKNEGFLTKLRAKLVKGGSLAMYAKELELNSLMLLGERVRGQGIEQSKSVLSDLFEALVGALYLDQGYEPTSKFVRQVIEKYVNFDEIINSLDNYKSLLLEYAQAKQMEIPTYSVISEEGPGHDKTFGVEVFVDKKPMARGKGKSKKSAEQEAARKALDKLEN